jgi:plastocyanin
MSIRKAFVLASVAVLGAAVVVLPTVALSETTPPSVVAENVGESHYWRPPSVTIEPGGQIAFSNPTAVPHGIHWISTPAGAPACTAGVPVGTTEKDSGTKWAGTCTFTAAGTYSYYCTVHGAAMSGTITVGAPTTTTTAPTGSTGTGTTSSPTGSTPTDGGPGGTTTPASAVLSALKLSSTHHGASVHGSLQVASAAAGGTLSVVLQAKLGGRRVQVGRFTRAYLAAGAQSWSIALSARARRALHAKRHLAVLAKVSLTPPGGTAVTLTRTVALHR